MAAPLRHHCRDGQVPQARTGRHQLAVARLAHARRARHDEVGLLPLPLRWHLFLSSPLLSPAPPGFLGFYDLIMKRFSFSAHDRRGWRLHSSLLSFYLFFTFSLRGVGGMRGRAGL